MFLPFQVRVGIPSGAEAAIHSLRKYAKKSAEKIVLVKTDFRKAFNNIRRDHILHLVNKNLPEMFPSIWQAYITPPIYATVIPSFFPRLRYNRVIP